MHVKIICSAAVGLLAACASAPREPAGRLADAGVQATSALGSDVRTMSVQLEYADVTDAFTRTWSDCQAKPTSCQPMRAPEANYEARRDLARVIGLRAQALDALRGAYAALDEEASYDGRADLAGATEEAVAGVNTFASAVAGLTGAGAAASLISEPITAGLSFGAGMIGERKQRRRILAASRVIRIATQRLRDALVVESEVFAELLAGVHDERSDARELLFKANLISASDLLKPMADQLNVKLVPNADAILTKSHGAKTAVTAAMRAMSRAELRVLQARYRASLAALDGVLAAHADLERKRPVSLAEVQRALAELDTTLDRHLPKED